MVETGAKLHIQHLLTLKKIITCDLSPWLISVGQLEVERWRDGEMVRCELAVGAVPE